MDTYRVCLADTVAGGMVHHARYFEIAERSRSATLGRVRLPTDGPRRRGRRADGAGLVLRQGAARFLAPAFVDDLLVLRSEVLKHGPARTWWRTAITRSDTLICTVDVELVCVDIATGRPRLMPPGLVDMIGRVVAASRVPELTEARLKGSAQDGRRLRSTAAFPGH
jgi:acyl-CoA thioester hydrolase